jgi:hypothetical protein
MAALNSIYSPIFPNDHGWPHVHVYKAEGTAKIAIGSPKQSPWPIEVSRKMRSNDVKRAMWPTIRKIYSSNGESIMAKSKLADKDISDQIDRARERGNANEETEPRAKSARFDQGSGLIVVELTNGVTFSFPPRLLQGLDRASAAELLAVRVLPTGNALSWDKLDAQFNLSRLVAGVFGNKPWMSHLGRLGGRSRSEVKAAAARANGRKGGRPAIKRTISDRSSDRIPQRSETSKTVRAK